MVKNVSVNQLPSYAPTLELVYDGLIFQVSGSSLKGENNILNGRQRKIRGTDSKHPGS